MLYFFAFLKKKFSSLPEDNPASRAASLLDMRKLLHENTLKGRKNQNALRRNLCASGLDMRADGWVYVLPGCALKPHWRNAFPGWFHEKTDSRCRRGRIYRIAYGHGS
jgi:hypothetical protein